jgi:RNA polymerase sigma factor (sigma-70 family)
MYRILLNKCYVVNRETGRAFDSLDHPAAQQATAPKVEEYGDIIRDPKTLLDECGDEVYRAFRGLSTAQRACILLRGIEKFSYQEIADIMEIPVGAVMTHLARGRKKLRGELSEYAKETGIIRLFPTPKAVEKQVTGEGST